MKNLSKTLQLVVAGKFTEAEQEGKLALAAAEEAKGGDHPHVVTYLRELAAVYQKQGCLSDATRLFERELSIQEKALGPDHPDVAISLALLGRAHAAEERYEDSEVAFKRCLAIWETHGSPGLDGWFALEQEGRGLTCSEALGEKITALLEQERDAEAEIEARAFAARTEITQGSHSRDVSTAKMILAMTVAACGQHEKALGLCQEALTIMERALGPKHPDLVDVLENMAELYENTGKTEESKKANARAMAIRAKRRKR